MTGWSVAHPPRHGAVSAAFWGGLIACALVGGLVGIAVVERATRHWPTGGAR